MSKRKANKNRKEIETYLENEKKYVEKKRSKVSKTEPIVSLGGKKLTRWDVFKIRMKNRFGIKKRKKSTTSTQFTNSEIKKLNKSLKSQRKEHEAKNKRG